MSQPPSIPLWNGPAPTGDGGSDPAAPRLTVHRPAAPNGAAVVICPGGGYGTLVTGGEGHGIAEWLGRSGITGLVLEYRLPAGRPMVPLLDARRALRLARANAAAWGIDARRVGIMGFSAGGHLAATAGTHPDDRDAAAADPVARLSGMPDFMILVYPVIIMDAGSHRGSYENLLGRDPAPELMRRFSLEQRISAATPPTYLAHALDDTVVPPTHSARFHDGLVAHGVRARYLALPRGGHGLDGYQGPMWDAWQAGSLAWLAELGIIPRAASSRP